MKRFNRRDLSLNPRDIMSLDGKDISSSNANRAVTDESDACHSAETNCACETLEMCDTRFECPKTAYFCHTEDVGGCDDDTWISDCYCDSKPGCTDSLVGCDSESQAQLCCEPTTGEDTAQGVCVDPSTTCPVSVDVCHYTDGCASALCVPETRECLDETVNICIKTVANDCEETDMCQISAICVETMGCNEPSVNVCLRTIADDCEETDGTCFIPIVPDE